MTASGPTMTERLALIASPQALERCEARIEDLVDPDVRAVVIRADHPELDRALSDGQHEIMVDGQPVSIRLHLTVHEVLANQLADHDPPEVYVTARRLLDAGYERHEVLHMLSAPLAEQIFATVQGGDGYDRTQHLSALDALPESWERRRDQPALTRQDPHGRHAARRRR